MIDRIRIYKDNINKSDLKFNNLVERRRKRDNAKYYIGYIGSTYNKINVAYFEKTKRLRLTGRLVNIIDDNRVYNFDDYLIKRSNSEIKGKNGVDDIIDFTNQELNKLLGTDNLDIRDFVVSYIEICFNIWLEDDFVDDYLEIFKQVYKKSKRKGYDLFIPKDVLMNKTEDYKSFYLRTNGDYKNNKLLNRIINFYNKLDQLERRSKEDDIVLKDREIRLAKNLLRLEIQLGYHYMYRLFGTKENKTFDKFLNLPLCYDLLVNEYKFFIGNPDLDFYSYKLAKTKIENTDLLNEDERSALLFDIRKRYKDNNFRSKATQRKYNKLLERLGIHHIFIPSKLVKKHNIHYLPSPIKLLDDKLKYYLENRIKSKHFILE